MKIRANKTKRHFTISVNGSKYRTTQMSKEEFNECEFNTESDWLNYMKSNEVIVLK